MNGTQQLIKETLLWFSIKHHMVNGGCQDRGDNLNHLINYNTTIEYSGVTSSSLSYYRNIHINLAKAIQNVNI